MSKQIIAGRPRQTNESDKSTNLFFYIFAGTLLLGFLFGAGFLVYSAIVGG